MLLHSVVLAATKLVWDKYGVNLHEVMTAPGLAVRIWRSKFYNHQVPLASIPYGSEVDAFIRNTYHGGITEVFEPKLKGGYSYDVNSLYPKAMAGRMPVGSPIYQLNITMEELCDASYVWFIKATCSPGQISFSAS
jgi:hypothetical protein